MEIIVVIIIVGILATLSVTGYAPIKERAVGREAQSVLRLIAAAERIYRMERGSYYPFTAGTNVTNLGWINSNLSLSITAGNWDYEIKGTLTGFDAFADRREGWGVYSTCTYKINETITDPVYFSGTCP